MADKTRQYSDYQNLDSLMEFEDHELRNTMQEFLEDEKKANTNIWNFATIAGIAMFFVGMIYIVQTLGLGLGPDLSGLIDAMPLIGGILVTLVGFGFLVGDRKKAKKQKKEKTKSESYDFSYNFDDYDYDDTSEEDFTLNNDLGSKTKSRKKKKSGSKDKSAKSGFDRYAFRQSKKLYKSRTDKKWAGVCGGLAKYFGISSTVIRLLFVITFFAGSGTSLLVYIGLAIALDKEPPEMMDEFNF